jgi:hypothetical protein
MPDHGMDDRRRDDLTAMRPDLDGWLSEAALRVTDRRSSRAAPSELWEAAAAVGLKDTGVLGRLIRWRIPHTPGGITFGELFRRPPFVVLEEHADALVSGLVGRIWTLRHDYPQLSAPDEFRAWSERGTARVVFGHWVEPQDDSGSVLLSDARVQAIGATGSIGVAAVRPLVRSFSALVGSEGLQAAVRRAERR